MEPQSNVKSEGQSIRERKREAGGGRRDTKNKKPRNPKQETQKTFGFANDACAREKAWFPK
jgi:hypothetical protein